MSRFIFILATFFSGSILAQVEVPTYCVQGAMTSGPARFEFQIQILAEPPPSKKVGYAIFNSYLLNDADMMGRVSGNPVFVGDVFSDQVDVLLDGRRFRCDCSDVYGAQDDISFQFMYGRLFSLHYLGYDWINNEALAQFNLYQSKVRGDQGPLINVSNNVSVGSCPVRNHD
jgi:hypothetical protein